MKSFVHKSFISQLLTQPLFPPTEKPLNPTHSITAPPYELAVANPYIIWKCVIPFVLVQ